MGKNFCKVDKKWCKFLSHNKCIKANTALNHINRCPRLAEIETQRLSNLLKEVTFEDVFEAICHWYQNQDNNKNGYRNVFGLISRMIPQKHKFDDLFIEIKKYHEDDTDYLHAHSINIVKKENITYGLEFTPWNELISMYITQETLNSLTKEEIVAACLYEMTFFGFEETTVSSEMQKIFDNLQKHEQ